MKDCRRELQKLAEEDFGRFQRRIVPTALEILGVRIPKIRALARACWQQEGEACLLSLGTPPETLEEAFLQAFFIEQVRDPGLCFSLVEDFLPAIDNWAVCDSLHPRAILNDTQTLRRHATDWCADAHEFARRFGIVTFLRDLTSEGFCESDPDLINGIRDDRRYVRMAQAWYFQKALAAQPDVLWPYFEEQRICEAVAPLAIQKCLDSRVFSEDEKDQLRKLRSARKSRCSQNATKL